MKTRSLPPLLLPALAGVGALVGAVWLTLAEPAKPTVAASAAAARIRPVLDLGPEMSGPSSQPVLALREGPKAAFERGRIEALLQAHRAKARPAEQLTPEMLARQAADMEQYIADYPDGEYTPGLRVEMGKFYRKIGRFSKALEHWREAWQLCAPYQDGAGRALGDESLVRLCDLLASFGRLEELGPLIQAHGDRVLSQLRLAEQWNITKEAYAHMARKPWRSYRCGAFAVFNVGRALTGNLDLGIRWESSPDTGFSLQSLVELAGRYQMDLVAAFREEGAPMVVPAVVHWKENHYAAITHEAEDGRYWVEDPTFRMRQRTDAETLRQEASGYYLIPRSQLRAGWRRVGPEEAATVFGRGGPVHTDDDDGPQCEGEGEGDGGDSDATGGTDCCEDGGGGSGTGSGTNECGMATWRVHEPNINLEVSDVPMIYRSAYGPDFVLNLHWRQRDLGSASHFCNFDSHWSSDLLADASFYSWDDVEEAELVVYNGGGFTHRYHFPASASESDRHRETGSWAKRITSGGSVTAIEIYYRNGSVDKYEYISGHGSGWLGITSRKDATGMALTYAYDGYGRLATVTTADGAAFTFGYTDPNDGYRVTGVTGPNSRSVTFTYTANYGGTGATVLSSITDVVGITSSFVYDVGTFWITQMTTPYGTTSFSHQTCGCSTCNPLTCTGVDRSVVVTEPNNDKQVYAFYDNGGPLESPPQASEMAGLIPSAFATNQVPTYGGVNDPPVQTLDLIRDQRNSHRWNRQQAAQLSTGNPASFTAADFRLSRTRHWLLRHETINQPTVLSWVLPPSADGTTESQPVFYDYSGKSTSGSALPLTLNAFVGDFGRPSVRARKMPDGTTRYHYFERNSRGMMTKDIERWVAGGTTLYRTNTFTYASGTGNAAVDSLLRIKHVGPSGELVFGYGLHPTYTDQVKYLTNGIGVTTTEYDANRRVTTRLTPAGLLSTYSYDGTSYRLLKVVDSISGTPIRTNSYTWLNGYVRTHTDPYGMTRTFDYDLLGRLTTTTYPDSTTEVSSYSLPANTGFNSGGSALPILDRVSFKDRLGNYWWTLPNRVRQVEKIIEPPKISGGSGTETTISYCGCGSPTAVSRASNTGSPETTNFEYNYRGGLKLVTLPDSAKFTNLFDLAGRLIERQDHYQKLTNTFDNLGRLVAQKNGAGLVMSASFDRSDRVLTQTNANGVWFTNAWDNLNRITVRTQPDGGKEYWGYTTNFPGATAYTNQVSDITTWAYDAALRKTNETVVGIYTNSFVYNGADDLKELYDGKTQKTAWAYDLYSRVTNKADHLGTNVLAYAYNANGWLTNRWSKQKGNTEYRYDPVGNLTNVNYPASADLVFEFDAFNRVVKDSRKGVITNTYTYQAGGQLATEATPQWASSTVTLGYTSRLRTSLTLAQPTIGNWTHAYTWDNARRLDTLTGSSGSFDYDYIAAATSGDYASRLVKKLTVPTTSAGPNITNLWDTTGRLTTTKLVNGATTFNSHAYVLNAAHQRTKQTRPDTSYVDYTYDDAGQLSTALSYYSGGSPISTEQLKYGYDAAQNLTKRTNNATVTTYTVNSLNQISNDGGASWTHDNNGNRTYQPNGVGSYTYTYDDENQLVQAETDTSGTPTGSRWKTLWTYDARGRVRIREDYGWYAPGSYFLLSTTTRYLYDGMRVIQERNASNVPQVTYTRGLDLAGSWERAGGIGGLLARTAHSGANYTYDPYGRLLASSGSLATANTYRFSSKELMLASGLYYYGYRFYDPNTQRWLNRDPIEEQGGMNLYGFVNNGPTQFTDALGLAPGDNWYGCDDPSFKKWFHRHEKRAGDPDGDKRVIRDAYKEWKDLGKPSSEQTGSSKGRGQGSRGGSGRGGSMGGEVMGMLGVAGAVLDLLPDDLLDDFFDDLAKDLGVAPPRCELIMRHPPSPNPPIWTPIYIPRDPSCGCK